MWQDGIKCDLPGSGADRSPVFQVVLLSSDCSSEMLQTLDFHGLSGQFFPLQYVSSDSVPSR